MRQENKLTYVKNLLCSIIDMLGVPPPGPELLNTIWWESLVVRKFGESSVIHQTKTIQIISYN